MATTEQLTEHQSPCLTCFLHPVSCAASVFGIQLFDVCQCSKERLNFDQNRISLRFYTLYQNFVEIFMWMFFFMDLGQITYNDFLCSGWTDIHEGDLEIAMLILISTDLFAALQFSILKRRKFHLVLSKSYNNEIQAAVTDRERFTFYVITFLLLFILLPTILVSSPVFEAVNNKRKSEIEAALCTVASSSWTVMVTGQLVTLMLSLWLFYSVLFEILKHLTAKLRKTGRNRAELKVFLQGCIEIHKEVVETVHQCNNLWQDYFALVHFYYLHLTCFLMYYAMFIPMDFYLKCVTTLFSSIYLVACITFAWNLSSFSSMLYSNFQDIGRFSSDELTIDNKLKMLNFMKTFARMPIGISVGGFFYVKRDFLIRSLNSFYSAFSTILELKGITGKRSCAPGSSTTYDYINRTNK